MTDSYDIDFLAVETKKSGDAIAMRYTVNGYQCIHVTDGGYIETGERLVEHINTHYGRPDLIHHVVITHPDGDHANGLRIVLENFTIGTLWILRPWEYAEQLIHRFETYSSVDRLRARLRALYPNLAELEEIALERGIQMQEPFQGALIGSFTVMAPSYQRYLDLVVNSERTPEGSEEAGVLEAAARGVGVLAKAVINTLRSLWGEEVFAEGGTSAENEMSVVQYAQICGHKILLTGDVGCEGLAEAADFAPAVGLTLPGLNKFQVPHHGSRHNVSTEILDRWLGPRLPAKAESAQWYAFISSAKEDEDHPRKSVVRAMIHRGAAVYCTEGKPLHTRCNSPDRGWSRAVAAEYPEEQEA